MQIHLVFYPKRESGLQNLQTTILSTRIEFLIKTHINTRGGASEPMQEPEIWAGVLITTWFRKN